jgi:hypothetical protein
MDASDDRKKLQRIPVLAPGCRLRDVGGGSEGAILIPEGLLKLSPMGLGIVRLVDGHVSLSALVDQLCVRFPSEDRRKIEAETCAFLEGLHLKRALNWK